MRIDLHADTPLLMHWAGYRFYAQHRRWMPLGAFFGHVDLPRMAAAQMDAQVFGLVSLPTESDPFTTVNQMIDAVENQERESEGAFQVVRNVAQLRRVRHHGARAVFLSVEGVHPLAGNIERAEALVARGVVSFGMAHFHANEACRPAKGLGRADDEGLSDFGKDLARFLGEHRRIVDLAHINRRGYFECLEHTSGPVWVSHTGASSVHAHWRNIDDAQIRAVADRGGVLGVIFARNYLGAHGIDGVIRHIQHVINVGGEESVALGSDFDGFIVPVSGLEDISGMSGLAQALADAGLPQRVVDGVMGRNALAMLESWLG